MRFLTCFLFVIQVQTSISRVQCYSLVNTLRWIRCQQKSWLCSLLAWLEKFQSQKLRQKVERILLEKIPKLANRRVPLPIPGILGMMNPRVTIFDTHVMLTSDLGLVVSLEHEATVN